MGEGGFFFAVPGGGVVGVTFVRVLRGGGERGSAGRTLGQRGEESRDKGFGEGRGPEGGWMGGIEKKKLLWSCVERGVRGGGWGRETFERSISGQIWGLYRRGNPVGDKGRWGRNFDY